MRGGRRQRGLCVNKGGSKAMLRVQESWLGLGLGQHLPVGLRVELREGSMGEGTGV
jgi:hypothetical protein